MPTLPTVKQLEAAVEAWGIGTYSWQHEGGGLCVSARCSELYGWSGSRPADALWTTAYADDRARTRRAFERALDPAGDGRLDLIHRVVVVMLERLACRSRTTLKALRKSGGTEFAVHQA